jgi:hypothetical protein
VKKRESDEWSEFHGHSKESEELKDQHGYKTKWSEYD